MRPGGRGVYLTSDPAKRKLDPIAFPEHLGQKYFFDINPQSLGRTKHMLPAIPQPEPLDAHPAPYSAFDDWNKNGGLGNLGYDQDMPLLLEHLTSLRQEITDLRNMNARTANRAADNQIDQSAVEMRANRLLEIKKELSQMLNRPEDPQVWWEKGGRRNRVA